VIQEKWLKTYPPICINVCAINKEVSERNHLPFLETICLVTYDVFNLLFIGLNFHIIIRDTQAGIQAFILAFKISMIGKSI